VPSLVLFECLNPLSISPIHFSGLAKQLHYISVGMSSDIPSSDRFKANKPPVSTCKLLSRIQPLHALTRHRSLATRPGPAGPLDAPTSDRLYSVDQSEISKDRLARLK
jgi:hypothetical protein